MVHPKLSAWDCAVLSKPSKDECLEADVQGFRLIRERRDYLSGETALGGEIREGTQIAHKHLKAQLESL